jgi:multidrug efflux pump subunit AcrB
MRGQEYLIRGTGRVQNGGRHRRPWSRCADGTPVLLGDVADVRIGAGPGSATARQRQPAVILSVQKQPDTNTLELTERIDETLADIRPRSRRGWRSTGDLPPGDFIETAVDNVLEALRDGAILVVVILFLFLWSVRTTFISVLAIPLSLVTWRSSR